MDAAVLAKSKALQVFCDRWDAPHPEAALSNAMSELRKLTGQLVPPIGLQKILTLINARVVKSPMSPRGRLQATKFGWIIHVPPDATWRVARFTIAHELSHLLMFDAVSGERVLIEELRTDDDLWWPIERLCDRGAAELLIPGADMRAQVETQLPQTRTAALRIYDRYMVSPDVFMRRICDVGQNRSSTVWQHKTHGSKPADWRITDVHSTLPKRSYIPKHLSAQSRLVPNLVEEASRTGFAYAEEATLTTGGQRHTGRMFAFNPTLRETDEVLPTFEGSVVPDNYSSTIHLLIDHTSVGPISRRTKFG